MPAGQIINIQGITLTNGSSAKIDLSIVEGKVLDILASDNLGIHAAAFIENPGQVKAGSVVYRTPDMIKTDTYKTNHYTSKTGADRNGDTPNSGTIKLDIDTPFSAKYYIETLDMMQIENAGQLETAIATSLSISVQTRLDLEFLRGIKDHIVAEKATAGKTITIADLSSATADTNLRTNLLKVSDAITDVETTLAANIVGTKTLTTTTISNAKAFKRMVQAAIDRSGANATDMQLNGGAATGIQGRVVLGDLMVKHLFMTRAVDTTLFTHDLVASDYDFSKFEAFILSTSAVAFAVNMGGIVPLINGDANPEFVIKGKYGFKVLRPQLIKGIINSAL